MQRLKLSFSKKKQKKIDRLAKHNHELEEILGYSERIIPISDKRKASEPVSHFEKLRQHAYAVHQTLANHWNCHRRCKCHAAHLSLRAEEVAVKSNVIFYIEGAQETPDMTRVEEVVIQGHNFQELPRSSNIGYVHQSDTITVLQRTVIEQDAASQAKTSLRSQFSKQWHERTSALMMSSRKGKESSSGSAKKKVKFHPSLPEPSVASPSSAEQLRAKDLEPIADICAFLIGEDQKTGILDDKDSNRTLEFSKLTKKESMRVTGKETLLSFSQLLKKNQHSGIFIPRRDRFEMTTHIASALLQTYRSPWLPPQWTKDNFYFLADDERQLVCSRYPLVSFKFASTPLTGDDEDENPSPQQQLDQARECLLTLGIMILELIFDQAIEDCDFRRKYYGVDGRPNDQTDVSTARHWARKVLGNSGPEISEVVRRCLDCSFGPEPNFADVRFREAVFEGVIKPLKNYAKTWQEVMSRGL